MYPHLSPYPVGTGPEKGAKAMEWIQRAARRVPGILTAAGVILFTYALLSFPDLVKDHVRQSILYCLTALVPSLFPFMALSCFTVLSPAGDVLGAPLGPLARWGFRLPGCCGASLLTSFLGGYPAGARSVSLLLEQGRVTRQEAARMMLFCVNPGTAFVVTYVGGGVLGSYRLGWLLFFSVTLSGVLLGLLCALPCPVPRKRAFPPKKEGGALIRSVSGAAHSVLIMCACIVGFSAVTALLHATGAFQGAVRVFSRLGPLTPPETAAALSYLLEVTGGVGDAAQLRAGVDLTAFGLAFGGLCVHLQVFAMFDDFPLKKRWFFLGRLVHGLLAAGCCHVLGALLPEGAHAALAPVAGQRVQPFSGTAAGGLSLLLLCAAFLLIAGKDGRREDP